MSSCHHEGRSFGIFGASSLVLGWESSKHSRSGRDAQRGATSAARPRSRHTEVRLDRQEVQQVFYQVQTYVTVVSTRQGGHVLAEHPAFQPSKPAHRSLSQVLAFPVADVPNEACASD